MDQQQPLSEDRQKALGKPAQVGQMNPQKVQEYLGLLTQLFEEEKINLLSPSSLINTEIYDALSEEQQGAVDSVTVSLIGHLRMLKQLIDLGETTSSQAEQYVQTIWQYKHKLEESVGDALII